MKKVILALLLAVSPVSNAFIVTEGSSSKGEADFNFDVCFVSETHRDWNFRSGEIKRAIESGQRVCSISMPQSPDNSVEAKYVRNRVASYISRIDPTKIYLPRIHEEYVKRHVRSDMTDRFIFVEPPDREMATRLVDIIKDFQLDSSKVWILYDQSTYEDKKIWTKHLKPLKTTVVKVRSKNSLRKYLRKINNSREAGVIINLMSSVEDAEYSRYMTYEEIKYELLTQNRLHLTVGVEETQIYNEAIVFDYDEVDTEVDAYINKEEFHRVRLSPLYLNSSWQYLGGFLGVRSKQ